MLDIKNLSDDLKKILDYDETGKFVISLYLPVDTVKHLKQDYTTKLNSLIVEKRAKLESDNNYSKNQKKNITDLLDRIKDYVNKSFVPESARTLLLYAGEDGSWVEVKLPVVLKGKIKKCICRQRPNYFGKMFSPDNCRLNNFYILLADDSFISAMRI